MNGRYLLDTNIVIALFANELDVKHKLASADQIFLPSIVVGELYYGAEKSEKIIQNLERIDELAANCVVLSCDTNTARHYGDIKNKLKIKGRPLPENDIWIASIAIQHELILVTRDEHFKEIENLKLERW
jgi:tRNA(fMet)-specific endonuclease VapC